MIDYCRLVKNATVSVCLILVSGLVLFLLYRYLIRYLGAAAHGYASLLQRMQKAVISILCHASGASFSLLLKLGTGGKGVKALLELLDHPLLWGRARDHFIVLVQKRWVLL